MNVRDGGRAVSSVLGVMKEGEKEKKTSIEIEQKWWKSF